MSKNYFFILILTISCQNPSEKSASTSEEKQENTYETPELSLAQAYNLAELPLACAVQEYPNKLGADFG